MAIRLNLLNAQTNPNGDQPTEINLLAVREDQLAYNFFDRLIDYGVRLSQPSPPVVGYYLAPGVTDAAFGPLPFALAWSK